MSKSLKSVNETEDFEKNARADLPAVHMHSLLAWQGGAARVMRLLARELAAQGCSVDCSSEINDSAEAEAVEKIFENNVNHNWSDFFDFCSSDRDWVIC